MLRTLVTAAVLLAVQVSPARAETSKLEGVVNLNTATPDELRLLSGVGPARVRNILAYRRAHPFRTIDELARIKGIGRRTVRRLRLHLAVSGPSTAQRVLRPDLPFVGPPQLPPAPPVPRGTPRPLASARPPAAPLRRGLPVRDASTRMPGNSCLPSP
jgi:competence protein ComEA